MRLCKSCMTSFVIFHGKFVEWRHAMLINDINNKLMNVKQERKNCMPFNSTVLTINYEADYSCHSLMI